METMAQAPSFWAVLHMRWVDDDDGRIPSSATYKYELFNLQSQAFVKHNPWKLTSFIKLMSPPVILPVDHVNR